jgi:hypothetical protein
VHGEELFRARSLLVERPGSSDGLVASCADCHERDGRDLQYFAYSSYSIIARSEFHGLSREDGRDIAAYIRGLALLDRDGNPYPPPGRPWNPPYQPGPGLDDRPIHEWAAGAGLEWVLASDDETREHLFPDGIDHEAMSRGVNLRELPVAVQFPDWNQWLPRVHPLDSWGDTAAWQDALAEYEGQRDLEEPGDYRLWNLVSRVGDLRNQSRADGWDYLTFITARNSAQRWGALRLWEIHQFNHLQDRVNEVSPEVEPRGWLRSGRVIFDLGPHILGNKGEEVNEGQWYFGAGRRGWGVWTHKWYYAQSVIAPGGNNRTVQTPVDWGYQGAFERSYAGNIEPSGWRAVALWLERMEIMTIPCSTAPGTTRCFGSHTATPAWLGQATDDGALYANVSAEDRARLLNWGIDAWVDAAERWEPDDYVRDGSVGSWEDASYVPSAETHRDRLTHQRHPAAYVFQQRADFGAFGVSARVCERLGAWGASMWPLDDWASFDCGAAGDPP